MDTKLVGDISERMVSLQLLKRGLSVLEPVGDRLPYDLGVDLAGRLIRLQVRTAYYVRTDDAYYGNATSSLTNRAIYKTRRADPAASDFFVFVIQDRCAFYVVPTHLVSRLRSLHFMPHRKRRCDKHGIEPYREAWQLILQEPVT
jgi:hypothetical protein